MPASNRRKLRAAGAVRPAWLCFLLLCALCACGPKRETVTFGGVTLDADAVYADLSGYELTLSDYEALSSALPGCTIRWMVPLGGGRFDSESEALRVPDFSSGDLPALACFPNLTRLDASGSTDYAAMMKAAALFPGCEVVWTVRLAGRTFACSETALDLSAPGDAPAFDTLFAALSGLPKLETADLTGVSLSDTEKAALMGAYPAISFFWTVEVVPGLTVNSAETELNLGANPLTDIGALHEKLALLPALKRVDLCGSFAPSDAANAQMDSLMAAFPQIRFVWTIRIDGYELRTDVTAFSMGQRKPLPGVTLIKGFSYARVTDETIQPLRYCVDLVALDIGHCGKITDISCLAGLTKLQYLVIAIAHIQDISPLSGLTELTYLECFNNKITDFSPLAKLTKLRFLNCGMNPATDLTPLFQLKSLERVWLSRLDVTQAQLDALGAALPKARIVSVRGADPSAYGWRKRNEGYLAMQKLFGLSALAQ